MAATTGLRTWIQFQKSHCPLRPSAPWRRPPPVALSATAPLLNGPRKLGVKDPTRHDMAIGRRRASLRIFDFRDWDYNLKLYFFAIYTFKIVYEEKQP
jgi:hypothetical protein